MMGIILKTVPMLVFVCLTTFQVQEVSSLCDDSHHECDNGSKCVLLHWVCDGEYDCVDKSDEVDCEDECSTEEFVCNSLPKTCMPLDWKCDGEIDCVGGSDEDGCAGVVCAAGRFSCGANTTCIPESLVCDGHADCVSGLDENPITCVNKTGCNEDEFQCVKDKNCISKRWLCDKDNDCLDSSDEVNCTTSTCEPNDWECNDGQCIPERWHCDGSFDCRDNSDEANCPVIPDDMSSQHCAHNDFYCRKSHQCIHQSWVCDADADCTDGTDEDKSICGTVTCLPNYFQCNTSGNCIPDHLVCDGIDHCDDKSDESEALCEEDHAYRPCDPVREFDCSSGSGSHCISLDVICDGRRDCEGGEDENRTHCLSYHNMTAGGGCEINNGGCSHDCINSRFGYYCSCPKGLLLAENNKVCEDINECLDADVCSHVCHNRVGDYKCSCHPGFELDPFDHTTCRAMGGEPMLIFSNRHDLRQIHLYTGRYRPLLEGVDSAVAIDYDVQGRTLFWSDVTSENISRVTFDESGVLMKKEVIVSKDVRIPDGLAFDWIHQNLYWTDTGNDRIEVLSLKNSSRWRKTLISSDLDEPRAIVVDPREKHRMMYWTDWGKQPKIERAYLDGSSRQRLITSDIEWPNGLTMDYETNRLFWVDAKLHIIASSDLVGGDRRVILTSYSFLKHPFAVAVFEDDVYWSDWHTRSILKASKHHSKQNNDIIHVASGLVSPMDLHIYHGLKQPAGEDVCTNACSHMCLPRLEYPGYTCLCPDDTQEINYELDRDGRTCLANQYKEDGKDGSSKMNKPPKTEKDWNDKTTTSPKNVAAEKLDKAEEHIQQNNGKLVVIAVSVTCTVLFLIVVILVFCYVVRMYRKRNIKTMNFDNPVYRKTTEEQICLNNSLSDSPHEMPVLLQPLTSANREVV